MPEPHARQGGFLTDLRQGTDWLLFVCRVVAFPVEVWVVRPGTWGPRYLDLSAVLGFVWPFVLVGFWGPHAAADDRAVLLFWWGVFALLLVHRVAGIRRRARGCRCHSRYRGDSWFVRPTDPPGTRRADLRELLVVLGAAAVIAAACRPLGALIFVGGVGLGISRVVAQLAVEARLRELDDLRIENEFYMDLFRARSDRW